MAQQVTVTAASIGAGHGTNSVYVLTPPSGTIDNASSLSLTYAQFVSGVTVTLSDNSINSLTITVQGGTCNGTVLTKSWSTPSATPTPTPTPTPTEVVYPPTPTPTSATPTPTPTSATPTPTPTAATPTPAPTLTGTCHQFLEEGPDPVIFQAVDPDGVTRNHSIQPGQLTYFCVRSFTDPGTGTFTGTNLGTPCTSDGDCSGSPATATPTPTAVATPTPINFRLSRCDGGGNTFYTSTTDGTFISSGNVFYSGGGVCYRSMGSVTDVSGLTFIGGGTHYPSCFDSSCPCYSTC